MLPPPQFKTHTGLAVHDLSLAITCLHVRRRTYTVGSWTRFDPHPLPRMRQHTAAWIRKQTEASARMCRDRQYTETRAMTLDDELTDTQTHTFFLQAQHMHNTRDKTVRSRPVETTYWRSNMYHAKFDNGACKTPSLRATWKVTTVLEASASAKAVSAYDHGQHPHLLALQKVNMCVGQQTNSRRTALQRGGHLPSACHIPTPSRTTKPEERDRHLWCTDDRHTPKRLHVLCVCSAIPSGFVRTTAFLTSSDAPWQCTAARGMSLPSNTGSAATTGSTSGIGIPFSIMPSMKVRCCFWTIVTVHSVSEWIRSWASDPNLVNATSGQNTVKMQNQMKRPPREQPSDQR